MMLECNLSEDVLVSVIVPVYNVEDYLEECLNSILKQTYRNSELILIDDGSTDNSGRIVDDYANKDSRVIAIHKTNGGLSDARNCGIEKAKGEYLLFIDSDDFVDENFIEELLTIALENKTEIAVCNLFDFYDPSECQKAKSNKPCRKVFNVEDALINIGRGQFFGVSACAKLFSKRLFETIRFPYGKKYEDLLTIPYIIEKVNTIAYSNQTHYYWRMRKTSITHSKISQDDIALVDYLHNFVVYFSEKFPNNKEAFICRFVNDEINSLLHRMVYDKHYYELMHTISKTSRKYWKLGLKNSFLGKKIKFQCFLLLLSPAFYRLFWKAYHFYAKHILKLYGDFD